MKEKVPHLISHHLCPYVQRAVITLDEKQVRHERTYIDLGNKPNWFLALSPLGKVPVLVVNDDVLFESSVICEYLDEVTPGSLHPPEPLRRAKHRAWIEFASATLDSIGGFYSAPDAESFDAKARILRSRLEWLERNLGDGPFFDGEEFHLVDAAWGPVFRYFDVFDEIRDFGLMDGLDKTLKYRAILSDRSSVQTAVPAGYPERLHAFLLRRGSYLTELIAVAA